MPALHPPGHRCVQKLGSCRTSCCPRSLGDSHGAISARGSARRFRRHSFRNVLAPHSASPQLVRSIGNVELRHTRSHGCSSAPVTHSVGKRPLSPAGTGYNVASRRQQRRAIRVSAETRESGADVYAVSPEPPAMLKEGMRRHTVRVRAATIAYSDQKADSGELPLLELPLGCRAARGAGQSPPHFVPSHLGSVERAALRAIPVPNALAGVPSWLCCLGTDLAEAPPSRLYSSTGLPRQMLRRPEHALLPCPYLFRSPSLWEMRPV